VADGKAPNMPVTKEVLRYFLSNPDAADSLTELARWRLMQETVRRSVEETREALNYLIAEGYVREETRLGTESLFQLNSARRKDAESFLDPGPKSSDTDG
jgi:hypothetical protein